MNSIIERFASHGCLIQKSALDYIAKKENPAQFVELLLRGFKELPSVITYNIVVSADENFKNGIEEQTQKEIISEKVNELCINEVRQIQEIKEIANSLKMHKPISKEYQADFRIINDISGYSKCEGELNDFVKYFRDRFERISRMLKQRKELAFHIPISKLSKFSSTEQTIIGMVSEVKKTTKGHKTFKIEDETGEVLALIPNNSENISLPIVNDEVIGVIGKMNQKELFIVKNIVFPNFSKSNGNRAEIPIEVAFISDIHIGSKTFLVKEWGKFLDWIKTAEAERIKYLVIGGDVVDGIGNYPNQEEELDIVDIFAQYENLAKYLKEIPEHIKIIMLPGNHDAVRQAEPQPTFPNEIRKYFDSNVEFVGNPCYFTLNNVEILAYHGRSMDDWIHQLSINYSHAIEIMKEMLKKRHLAPIYGGKVSLAPEHKDYLTIEKIPDIFITGHGHSWGIENHRGVILINSSAWQSQTSYQKMLNQVPNPCKVSVVNLQNMKFYVKSFQ